jgi:hypothetical protein
MYDAYRCCTLPRMRMCARTSNIKITNTERKFTQERKVGHRGCAGRGNVVAPEGSGKKPSRRFSPSNARGPESLGGSTASCEESQKEVTALVEKKLGAVQRTVEERREATKSGSLVQGRKDAACRQGCRHRVPGRTTTGLDSFVRP